MSRLPAGDANAMFRKAVRRIVPRARFNGYFYLTQMIIHFIVTSAILCYTRHGVLAGDLQKHDYNICRKYPKRRLKEHSNDRKRPKASTDRHATYIR